MRIRDLAQVQLGPDYRSGAIDLNGSEAVGGVVVMRFGENPRDVIQRVREKIRPDVDRKEVSECIGSAESGIVSARC